MNVVYPRRVGMGASSLLMILVVLSLTTLGVLSFSGALVDARLSERAASNAAAYYDANARMQAQLAQLDAELASARESAANSVEYEQLITEFGLEMSRTDRILFTLVETLDDDRYLRAVVEALPFESAERYVVRSYRVEDEREWGTGELDLAIG